MNQCDFFFDRGTTQASTLIFILGASLSAGGFPELETALGDVHKTSSLLDKKKIVQQQCPTARLHSKNTLNTIKIQPQPHVTRTLKKTPSHIHHDEKRSDKKKIPLATKQPRLKEKKITLTTRDGVKRRGILSISPNARGNVVLCHPASRNKEFMQKYAMNLFPNFNHIRFDFRKHGEEVENQCTSIGRKERFEVEAAVREFKRRKRLRGLPLYGFGISMGAAALIEAESRKKMFDALILQSCFETLRQQIKRMYPFFRMPLMEHFIYAPPVTYLVRKWYNYDIGRLKPLKSIKKITTPLFFIHAQDDAFIPVEAYYKLRSAARNIVHEWIPKTGRHSEILEIHPEEYPHQCSLFFKKLTCAKQTISNISLHQR